MSFVPQFSLNFGSFKVFGEWVCGVGGTIGAHSRRPRIQIPSPCSLIQNQNKLPGLKTNFQLNVEFNPSHGSSECKILKFSKNWLTFAEIEVQIPQKRYKFALEMKFIRL